MIIMKKNGKDIMKLLEESGFNQNTLNRNHILHNHTISRIKSGEIPSMKVINKVCLMTGLGIEDFFEIQDDYCYIVNKLLNDYNIKLNNSVAKKNVNYFDIDYISIDNNSGIFIHYKNETVEKVCELEYSRRCIAAINIQNFRDVITIEKYKENEYTILLLSDLVMYGAIVIKELKQ